MYETAKTLSMMKPEEKEKYLHGRGIDIGCGPDPVTADCVAFDLHQGDANHILDYIHDTFDFVWSSHCLEHMINPPKAILDWWQLVKPGGWMILTVPDEDLYEQGVFPSRFNLDHKWTFTISKAKSWSPVSINLLELIPKLPECEEYQIKLQDHGYDRTLLHWGNSNRWLRLPWYLYLEFKVRYDIEIPYLERFASKFASVDQTLHKDRMAQIISIVRKKETKNYAMYLS